MTPSPMVYLPPLTADELDVLVRALQAQLDANGGWFGPGPDAVVTGSLLTAAAEARSSFGP